MPPTSFTDLYADVGRRRDAGDTDGAIALVRDNLKTFPLHRGLMHLVLAELLIANARPGEAITALQQAVAAGCRYKAEWLTTDPRVAPLLGDARFMKLVRKSDEQYAADAAAARPDVLVRAPSSPPAPSGRPLLIALHGNNSNARETARQWSSAVDDGWVVAIPQSSEIGASPEAFTWNDRVRTRSEIAAHVVRVRELHRIDDARVVLAGFSMGALQAVALPLAVGFEARGVLPVAAWLPNVDEFTGLLQEGGGRAPDAYVVVGEADPSHDGALQLAALLQKHGARVKLDVRAGMGHEYPPDMKATLSRALEFLAG